MHYRPNVGQIVGDYGWAMRLFFLVISLAAGVSAGAADPAPDQDNVFKRGGKQIAKDAKAGGRQAGKAYSDLGKSIGRGTSKTLKDIGKSMKESSARSAQAFKDTF
jgi:hypothetical protein